MCMKRERKREIHSCFLRKLSRFEWKIKERERCFLILLRFCFWEFVDFIGGYFFVRVAPGFYLSPPTLTSHTQKLHTAWFFHARDVLKFCRLHKCFMVAWWQRHHACKHAWHALFLGKRITFSNFWPKRLVFYVMNFIVLNLARFL